MFMFVFWLGGLPYMYSCDAHLLLLVLLLPVRMPGSNSLPVAVVVVVVVVVCSSSSSHPPCPEDHSCHRTGLRTAPCAHSCPHSSPVAGESC